MRKISLVIFVLFSVNLTSQQSEKKVKFKPKKLKPIKRRRAVDVFARVKPQRTESAEEFLFG